MAFADCDVDAPNIHLVMSQNTKPVINNFYGFQKAYIDSSKCISCGLCEENCHFGAIKKSIVSLYECEYECEGCGVCCELYSENAVSMTEYALQESSWLLFEFKLAICSLFEQHVNDII